MIILTKLYKIQHGHIGRVLNKWRNSQPWLDENIYDIASCVDSSLRNIRLKKDALTREINNTQNDIKNLFTSDQIQALLGNSHRESEESNIQRENQIAKQVLKILRILRPNAPPSYRESSASYLDLKAKGLLETHGKTEEFAEHFTTQSFVLSILALCKSLEDDIKQLYSEITGSQPDVNDNSIFGLRDTINKLYEFITLKKDINDAKRWSHEVWPKISKFFNLLQSEQDMADWLQAHIARININSDFSTENISSEDFTSQNCNNLYSLGSDFNRDSSLRNETLETELAMGIPRSKYGLYFKSLLNMLNHGMSETQVEILSGLFTDLLITLEDLGLFKWIDGNLPLDTLEPLPDLSTLGKFTNETILESSDLIKTLARGDALLSNHFPTIAEFINADKQLMTPENPYLTDAFIDAMFSKYTSYEFNSDRGKEAPFDILLDNHLRFHKNLGPSEHFLDDNNNINWKWKTPAGAVYDQHREMYLRTNSGIDPMLRLDKMRCAIVDRRQTLSMSKAGRMYFTRCVVAVGDGKGYFGMGVGHGATIADARNDGILNALKDMFFIDFDRKIPILTPVRGQEYGTSITITPRPLGKGLRVSGRYLPLAYLTGLDDCKISFSGTKSWITRMRALRKALEQIYSKATMANSTGLKYTHLFCPGDHTIHWPDRWFIPILNEYKKKIANIRKHRIKSARKAVRRRMPEITPSDLKTDIPHYAHKTPLQKWQYEQTQQRYSNKNNNQTQSMNPDLLDQKQTQFDLIEPGKDELNFSIDGIISEIKE